MSWIPTDDVVSDISLCMVLRCL